MSSPYLFPFLQYLTFSEMNLARYKYVVQVVIGEQRGEGVRMGCRCFWDSETDNIASETFVNVRDKMLTKHEIYNEQGGVKLLGTE